jgi:hypothetical protein
MKKNHEGVIDFSYQIKANKIGVQTNQSGRYRLNEEQENKYLISYKTTKG